MPLTLCWFFVVPLSSGRGNFFVPIEEVGIRKCAELSRYVKMSDCGIFHLTMYVITAVRLPIWGRGKGFVHLSLANGLPQDAIHILIVNKTKNPYKL